MEMKIPNVEQIETPMVVGGKRQIDNVVPSHTKIESRIAVQIACTTEHMLAKEIATLVANSLDDILQWAYEKERTGVLLAVYNVFE